MKLFEIYKAEKRELLSIKDILIYEKSALKNLTFILAPEFKISDQYFSIIVHQLVGENDMSVMLQITDNSHQVQFHNEKSHNELLKMINATVNHELRNPLNSIVAFNT